MEGDIEKKQAYLREEIIDQQYSPEEFAEYLLTLKADGGDLEKWTLLDLVGAVKKFKKSKMAEARASIEHQEKLEELQKKKSEEAKLKEKDNKEEEVDFSKCPQLFYAKYNLYDASFRKKVKCQKIEKFLPRSGDKFQVMIDKPEIKKSGGIFGFGGVNKLWFSMRNNVANKEVLRADEDFEWLRNSYLRLYPGKLIPPLEAMRENTMEDKVSREIRAQMIRRFLEAVSKDQELFNTELTISFLTTDPKNIETYKKRFSAISSIRVLSAMANLEGFVEIEISPLNHKLLEAASLFSHKTASIYDQMKNHSNNIAKNYEDLTHNVYKFGEGFAKLQEAYSRSIEMSPDLLNPALSNAFINMNNMLVELGRSYHQQRNSIERNFSYFFRFNKLECESVVACLDARQKIENEYLEFKSDLLKRKEQIYDNPLRWELPQSFLATIKPKELSKDEAMKIMLPKDTDKENRMKQWLSFINRKMQLSYEQLLDNLAHRYIHTFQGLGTQFLAAHKTEGEVFNRMAKNIAE